jgi:hypothetical protein
LPTFPTQNRERQTLKAWPDGKDWGVHHVPVLL